MAGAAAKLLQTITGRDDAAPPQTLASFEAFRLAERAFVSLTAEYNDACEQVRVHQAYIPRSSFLESQRNANLVEREEKLRPKVVAASEAYEVAKSDAAYALTVAALPSHKIAMARVLAALTELDAAMSAEDALVTDLQQRGGTRSPLKRPLPALVEVIGDSGRGRGGSAIEYLRKHVGDYVDTATQLSGD